MEAPLIPENESERQRAVDALGLVGTPAEERFDRITRTASENLNAPISTISIIDRDREWFKSSVGVDKTEGSREHSFCGHTITKGLMFVVEDTKNDQRFSDNPQVVNPPHVRFYAGVTLHDRKTHLPIGAFCIKDTKPRTLKPEELKQLQDYARQAEDELNSASTASGAQKTDSV